MVSDVMVTAAFVVVSVAVLACFSAKHVLTWLKKPHRRLLPVPGPVILSRRRFTEICRPHAYAGPELWRKTLQLFPGQLNGQSIISAAITRKSWRALWSARGPLRFERDLRLDFFRGLALFSIFIDHTPGNHFAWFTLQAVMCADAAEVFVVISGITAGMVYSRTIEREGFVTAGVRVYHRVWQLYVANVVLFVTLMAIISSTADVLQTSRYIEYFEGTSMFLQEPGLMLAKVLSLQFQPSFIDILPLYIACLGFLPLVLAGFRLRSGPVILASLSLWVLFQFDGWFVLPGSGWSFNPFAWQALFYLGAWLGWRSNRAEVFWLDRRWQIYLAAGFVVAGFLIRFNWTLQGFYGPITTPIPGEPLWQFMSKANLGLFRFVNIVAVTLLVGHMIHPRARFFDSLLARPFVLCGRHSLHIFCLSAVLAVFGQLILTELFGRWPMQLAVSVTGIAIMVGFAAVLEWLAAAQTGRSSGSRRQVGKDLARSATLVEGQTAPSFGAPH
jgi:hypothetical protein